MSVTANFVDQFTLTVNTVGNGTVTVDPNQATYTYGQTVTLTAVPDPGWTFANWSGDLTGSTNPDQITITGDMSVTANFTQDQYTLTASTIGNGTVTADPNQALYTYGQIVTLTAVPDPNWAFDFWSGDLSGSTNPEQITITGDMSVTANFTDQYTLALNTTGNGTVTADPNQPTYTYGQIVTLTAIPDPNWAFDSWSGDLSGSNNPDQITITGNMSVTANFVAEGCPTPGFSGNYCMADIYPNNGDGVWDYAVDGDCIIGLSDLGELLPNYGMTSGATREDGDVYPVGAPDGAVGLSDLGELLAQYGDDCN
jgi:uncharacterized repeat protein (TIGR02543 family)